MDKETLSNYGWIVICVLVLAVMIALATPFGTFVADAVKSTTQGLFDTNQSALNSTGLINIDGQSFGEGGNGGAGGNGDSDAVGGMVHDGPTIPEGATYTKVDGTVLNAGDAFPENVANGDIYTYEEYKYTFNKIYLGGSIPMNTGTYDGWHVEVTDKSKTSYGPMLESINGKATKSIANLYSGCTSLTDISKITIPSNVTDLTGIFRGCSSIKDLSNFKIPNNVTSLSNAFQGTGITDNGLPVIPSSVTNLSYTFAGCDLKDLSGYTLPNSIKTMYYTFNCCYSLTDAPTIPDSVTNMQATFFSCTSLKTLPNIPDSVTSMEMAFVDCKALFGVLSVPCTATTNSTTTQGATGLSLSVRHVDGCDGSCGK